jgi:hypothetical protein
MTSGPALRHFSSTTLRRPQGRLDAYAGQVSVTCDFCGRQEPGDEPPLTWTTAVERGRVRRFCDDCSREHLRSMEAKLDSEWW